MYFSAFISYWDEIFLRPFEKNDTRKIGERRMNSISLKLLVIGLGSMGRRRARLTERFFPGVALFGVDSRPDRREEFSRQFNADVFDSLDEAFELYKKGLDEVKSANDMVQGMEKAMLVLNSDGQLEEF